MTKRLKSKVMEFPFQKLPRLYGKRYVPYCDFGRHQGLILREDICKSRGCDHYYKLFLDKNNKTQSLNNPKTL